MGIVPIGSAFWGGLYIGVQAFMERLALSAEIVEKVQMANSDNFCTFRNQQLTGHRKPKNDQI